MSKPFFLRRILFLCAVLILSGCAQEESVSHTMQELTDGAMLVVLSAPSVHDDYYQEKFQDIVDFHVRYANTVYGNDAIVILADADTLPSFDGKVPADALLQADVFDIWLRDFTTVNPYAPVQFRYAPSYFDHEPESPVETQASFNDFAAQHGLAFATSDYILDGGVVVDNYQGDVIISERFLEDNDLTKDAARQVIKDAYGAQNVAIVPYDDEIMGHTDGMLMLVDDTVFLNRYDDDPAFRAEILAELTSQMPHITVVEVDATYELTQWKDFASACGINVNSLVTENHIYVPTFADTPEQQAFLATLAEYTDKTVHTIDARGVCMMGGSVRCLSTQYTGENARRLLDAAAGQ